ncbi:hypothetical protein Ccrd_000049 [Cynara cardunculus var. scolymus]|uniref:Uncharacterized protein n=1 Tax=Cynara cardunculus var. scolymus TaxID=59895 RepID=A0A103XVU2_CYNCS|nr:hypothetical protein Ccrd_000049 [Cynara cardunculus var. scolymus]
MWINVLFCLVIRIMRFLVIILPSSRYNPTRVIVFFSFITLFRETYNVFSMINI